MKQILRNSIRKSLKVVFSMYNVVLVFTMTVVEIMIKKGNANQLIIDNIVILFLIPVIVSFVVIFILYLIDRKKIKINKDEETYYRDIIKEISPVELSYIDDYGVELEKDVIATLLSLQLRKKLEITDENIKILDKDIGNLLCHEKFVINIFLENEKYHYNDKKLLFNKKFQKELMKDLKNSGLVCDDKEKNFFHQLSYDEKTKLKLILISALVVDALCNILVYGIIERNNFKLFKIICMIILIGYQVFINRFCIKNITIKGKEVKYKLHGLKMFLKDYSDMKSKNINELGLWDEYMIYSVILGNNKKVKKQVMKVIKKYFY